MSPGIAKSFEILNSFRLWKLPLLVAGIAAAVFGGRRARRFLAALVLVLLVNDTIVTNALKASIDRPRPSGAEGLSGSFPSAHAVNSFSAATLAVVFYGRSGAFLFLPAALIAIGRVVQGAHYPGDVAGGALLGVLLTLAEVYGFRRLARSRIAGRWKRSFAAAAPDRRWKTAGWILLGSVFLFRLGYVAAGAWALVPDEAYYWTWSRHLAPSYYSKGPGIALQIAATTALFGDTEFGVRIGPVLLSLLIGLLLWKETLRRRGPVEAFFVVLTLALIPLFSAGSVLATIDAPLLTCWTIAMILYARAIEVDGGPPYWIALGAVLGVGYLAKFSILLLVPGLLAYAIVSGAWRSPRTRRGLLWMTAAFVPFLVPFVAWNHAHDWPTVKHLVERGGLDTPASLRLDTFGEFLGVQILLITPVLWFLLVAGTWKEFRSRGRADVWTGTLVWGAVPTVIFYGWLSFRSRIQPNWVAPIYLSMVPAAVAWFTDRYSARQELRKRIALAARAALVLAAVASVVVYRGDLLWKLGYDPPVRMLPQRRLLGWRELARHVDAARDRLPDPDSAFVLGTKYQIAAEMAFYGRNHPRVDTTAPLAGRSQFDFWDGIEKNPGADAVLVALESQRRIAETVASNWFEQWEEYPSYLVAFRDHPVERYLVFLCRNYRGGATGLSP